MRKNQRSKETKKCLLKKEVNVDKQELTSPGCRETSKERQINWIVCRIYSVCMKIVCFVFKIFLFYMKLFT